MNAFPASPASCPGKLDDVLALPSRRIDPALVWALLTNFKGFGGARARSDFIPFLIEVRDFNDLADTVFTAVGASGQPLVMTPVTYRARGKTRYATVQVRLEDIDVLLRLPCLRRAEMGLPAGEAPAPRDQITPASIPAGTWPPTAPVIGTIDHGIAFLHRNFCLDLPAVPGPGGSAGSPARTVSRIVRFWDQWTGLLQQPQPAAPATIWKHNGAFGYGRYFDAAAIEPSLRVLTDELAQYAAFDYQPATSFASHGTHVLDVAAGPYNRAAGPAAVAFAEPASTVPIIAVQLPWLPETDLSGASLGVNVLDALRFILDSAQPRSRDAPLRNIVVNLSDGALCGSHNGGSVIEAAIDELLEKNQNLSLVLAAGNAYETGTHAAGTIDSQKTVSLAWQVLPDDRTESFVEIWMPAPTKIGLELLTPDGAVALSLDGNEVAVWAPGAGNEVLAAAVQLSEVATGAGQLARIALRPTRPRNPRDVPVPHGIWNVRLTNKDSQAIQFDAWIQRDDPPFGETGPRRQSFFVAQLTDAVSGRNTLNSLSTGKHPIVVGGFRLSDSSLARYTSCGSDAGVPTVVAPCEEGYLPWGLRAAANRSGATTRMNGTSVAAPLITRKIANALSAPHAPLQVATVKNAVAGAAQARVPPVDIQQPSSSADTALRSGQGWLDAGTAVHLP